MKTGVPVHPICPQSPQIPDHRSREKGGKKPPGSSVVRYEGSQNALGLALGTRGCSSSADLKLACPDRLHEPSRALPRPEGAENHFGRSWLSFR